MSDTLKVRKGERGVVRVFVVDASWSGPKMTSEPDRTGADADPHWPLQDALGLAHLDAEFIELFDVADLGELGLAGYMIEGLGIAEADVTMHRAQLDAIKGEVLLVYSKAFGGFETTLRPQAPLRWIGTYQEDRPPVSFDPLSSEAAQGETVPDAKPRPSDAAMSGRVAMVALLVIFALTGVVVWVAS